MWCHGGLYTAVIELHSDGVSDLSDVIEHWPLICGLRRMIPASGC